MPDLDDLGEAVGKKVGPFPLWVWVALGAGTLFLFVSWRSGKQQASSGSNAFAFPSGLEGGGGAGGVSQGQLQDMSTDLQTLLDERFGEITEANADALAGTQQQLTEFMGSQATWFQSMMDAEKDDQQALLGALSDQSQSYKDALASNNANFLTTMQNLLTSYKPNGTAPTQTADPMSGAPDWLSGRLQSSYWMSRKYVKKDDSTLGSQYSAAVNDYLRSDSTSGLNTGGQSAAGTTQLNSLISQGLVAINPFYKG
jgi:hypothetical protein